MKKQISQQQQPQVGHWVQTERAAHEAWAMLISRSPQAAKLMHLLTARVGPHNAVVVSHKVLQQLMGVKSLTTVKTALKTLSDDRWIEIRQIGDRGTVNAYVLNDRVVWSDRRDNLRHSLFSASVVVSADEQPDQDQLGLQAPLRRLPSLMSDERQLPSGPGLPPPSQPFLKGLEADLPSVPYGMDETDQ
jgi:hypothetical protein